MKLDVFCEAQRVGPRNEGALYEDILEQARLADMLGFTTWWMVEHHGAGEYSYSSTPELLLTWIATQTDRIRLGHSGVLAPFKINHPIRAAERGAMLDHISGGRVEFGMARSLAGEWEAFEIDVDTSRDQLVEALRMIPQMWTRENFAWDSKLLQIPERNIIPKPLQKPHPPLWSTTGSGAAFRLAGSLGVGAIGNTLLTALDGIQSLLAEYRSGLAECERPAGSFRNERKAIFTFVHVAESEKAAVESGACNAALWYMARMPEVFHAPPENVWELIRGGLLPNDPNAYRAVDSIDPAQMARQENEHPIVDLVKRHASGEKIGNEEAYETLSAVPSVIVGDPASCRKKAEAYADLGVDQLMCFMQIADLSQARVLESMRNVGKHLIPYFDR